MLTEALTRVPTRLISYCVMPNHWHFVLWPRAGEMPRFMHWLTLTHAKRWHRARGTDGSGPLYKDRYKAVPVQGDHHLLVVLRYVERNPVRAGLVSSADEWRWSSIGRQTDDKPPVPLTPSPVARPDNWLEIVNLPHTHAELEAMRAAIGKGRPVGDPEWARWAAALLQLKVGEPGRPTTKPGLVSSYDLRKNQTRFRF